MSITKTTRAGHESDHSQLAEAAHHLSTASLYLLECYQRPEAGLATPDNMYPVVIHLYLHAII